MDVCPPKNVSFFPRGILVVMSSAISRGNIRHQITLGLVPTTVILCKLVLRYIVFFLQILRVRLTSSTLSSRGPTSYVRI